jgi:hypothetical protein
MLVVESLRGSQEVRQYLQNEKKKCKGMELVYHIQNMHGIVIAALG